MLVLARLCKTILPLCAAAGLDVGDHLRSKDELRKQWEEFQERAEQKQQVSVWTNFAFSL